MLQVGKKFLIFAKFAFRINEYYITKGRRLFFALILQLKQYKSESNINETFDLSGEEKAVERICSFIPASVVTMSVQEALVSVAHCVKPTETLGRLTNLF